MKRILSVCFWMIIHAQLIGQEKYWIFFNDKDLETEQAKQVAEFPERIYDLPISPGYITHLQKVGIVPIHSSRWLNGISAYLDEGKIDQLENLSFIKELKPVQRYSFIQEVALDCDSLLSSYGPGHQLEMLGIDLLHEMGMTGRGVTVAVFDNGFSRLDSIEAFQHLFEEKRILATRDYVDGDDNVYEMCASRSYCRHGTAVLSTLAAKSEQGLLGAAPGANYILLRTEEDGSETSVEEDNWVAAAEFAADLGAKVFSTSLGYLTFDGGIGSYSRDQLDGKTAIITRAAEIAAEKGIVVVNSAGNSGTNGIIAPADGPNVLAIGAVDACANIASFSSQGPSADGRIKPDLVALGRGTYVISSDGNQRKSNGTSFSAPIISGLFACLMQASPQANREALYQSVYQSADRYASPDMEYGYGLPSAEAALSYLQSLHPPVTLLQIFPNPSQDYFMVNTGDEGLSEIEVSVYDVIGKLNLRYTFSQTTNSSDPIRIEHSLLPGVYVVRIIGNGGEFIKGTKLVVN